MSDSEQLILNRKQSDETMLVITSQIAKLRHQAVENSYLVDSLRSFEIKKDLATRQFICKIFEYSHPETFFLKLQYLSKRFYNGIMPSWLHETSVYNIRLSEGHLSQPTGSTMFEFPEPGHFSALSNKEKLQVRLDGVAFDSYQQWVFKLSDGKKSDGQTFTQISQIGSVK